MPQMKLKTNEIFGVDRKVGQLYTGDTDPGDSTKLNYDGNLYSANFGGTFQGYDVALGDSEGLYDNPDAESALNEIFGNFKEIGIAGDSILVGDPVGKRDTSSNTFYKSGYYNITPTVTINPYENISLRHLSVVGLSNNRFFVGWCQAESPFLLMTRLCEFTGDTIIHLGDTILINGTNLSASVQFSKLYGGDSYFVANYVDNPNGICSVLRMNGDSVEEMKRITFTHGMEYEDYDIAPLGDSCWVMAVDVGGSLLFKTGYYDGDTILIYPGPGGDTGVQAVNRDVGGITSRVTITELGDSSYFAFCYRNVTSFHTETKIGRWTGDSFEFYGETGNGDSGISLSGDTDTAFTAISQLGDSHFICFYGGAGVAGYRHSNLSLCKKTGDSLELLFEFRYGDSDYSPYPIDSSSYGNYFTVVRDRGQASYSDAVFRVGRLAGDSIEFLSGDEEINENISTYRWIDSLSSETYVVTSLRGDSIGTRVFKTMEFVGIAGSSASAGDSFSVYYNGTVSDLSRLSQGSTYYMNYNDGTLSATPAVTTYAAPSGGDNKISYSDKTGIAIGDTELLIVR